MTKQEQFFYDNAGYSYDPKNETKAEGRLKCAKALAAAETWALQNNYWFRYEPDNDCDWSFLKKGDKPANHTAIYIQMLDENDSVVQTLAGVVDADEKYKRVVRAELALEEMRDNFGLATKKV